MKSKPISVNRSARRIEKDTPQWQLHQTFLPFLNGLKRRLETGQLSTDPPKSAPAELVDLVF